MAYGLGIPILVLYQAQNAKSGLTISMDIYDETQSLDVAKSASAMAELGTTGRYYASFTPDASGYWTALMQEPGVKGPVVKVYKIGEFDEDGMYTGIEAIKSKTDNLPIDPADQSLIEAAIVASEDVIQGSAGEDLTTLASKISAIESPAMVG